MNEILKRITVNPAVMTGLPCIRGMRIPATTILGLLAAGATDCEILADYPDLESEDIKACLEYAAILANKQDLDLICTQP